MNMCTALVAANVIQLFEDSWSGWCSRSSMPIVASMGGNAGTQTMTVVVRALATCEPGYPMPGASSAARRRSAFSTVSRSRPFLGSWLALVPLHRP